MNEKIIDLLKIVLPVLFTSCVTIVTTLCVTIRQKKIKGNEQDVSDALNTLEAYITLEQKYLSGQNSSFAIVWRLGKNHCLASSTK